jgi:hypothetical protein
MGYSQIFCLAVSLRGIVGLQVASKASLDLPTVGPDIEQRDDLDAVDRTLQIDGLVANSNGQVAIERQIGSTNTTSDQLGKLGRCFWVERREVSHDLRQIHADLLPLHVDGHELVADLTAHLRKSPEGTVRLTFGRVLALLLAAMTGRMDGELEAELLVLDVRLKRALAIETRARAQRGHAGAMHEKSLLWLLEALKIHEVADFWRALASVPDFGNVNYLPPGSSMNWNGFWLASSFGPALALAFASTSFQMGLLILGEDFLTPAPV